MASTPGTPRFPSGATGGRRTARSSPPSWPAPCRSAGGMRPPSSAAAAGRGRSALRLICRRALRHRADRPGAADQHVFRANRPAGRRPDKPPGIRRSLGLNRFVALAYSEGCGSGRESMYQRLHHTDRGYATHPNVTAALLFEHGCEKIPNDAMRRQFESAGLPLNRFDWASVQLDRGHRSGFGESRGMVRAGRSCAAAGPAPARRDGRARRRIAWHRFGW